MARGQRAEVGATRVAQNGYHYTKVEDGSWKLTHWITAEEKILGRPLKDNEMVKFVDKKFKADPYNPKGLTVIKKKTSSLRRQLANVQTRIQELQAEEKYLKEQLDKL